YMRIGAGEIPDLFARSPFEIGRGRLITAGEHVTVVSTGQLTAPTMAAVTELAERGIRVEHIGLATVQPLDRALLLESVERTGRIVTIEEHYVRGGLGGAVAEMLAEEHPVPHRIIGVPHRYVSSGPYAEILQDCGLDAVSLAAR